MLVVRTIIPHNTAATSRPLHGTLPGRRACATAQDDFTVRGRRASPSSLASSTNASLLTNPTLGFLDGATNVGWRTSCPVSPSPARGRKQTAPCQASRTCPTTMPSDLACLGRSPPFHDEDHLAHREHTRLGFRKRQNIAWRCSMAARNRDLANVAVSDDRCIRPTWQSRCCSTGPGTAHPARQLHLKGTAVSVPGHLPRDVAP